MKERKLYATDHRAFVLESVATNPQPVQEAILKDCIGPDFPRKSVQAMLWQLAHEGLISRRSEDGVYSLTYTGLYWLQQARFDKALPSPHTRKRKVEHGNGTGR